MNLVSCFKGLALVLLWKLDLFTFVESSSSRVPSTEQNPRLLSAYNDNNSNSRYYPGRYGHRSHRRPRYHDANRGKLPPGPPPHLSRYRSWPRKYSGHGYRGQGPTHFGPGYSSHHTTYDYDSDGGYLIHLDISNEFSTNRYTVTYENNLVVFRARSPCLFTQVKHGNELLWRYKGQGYPNKVTLSKINGRPKVEVHFPETPRRSAGKYRPPGFIYTSPDHVPSQQPNTVSLNVPHLKPTQPIPAQDVMEFELFTVGDRLLFRPKIYTGTGLGRPALISVNVDRFETNDQVIYSYDSDTKIHTLRAREPYLINEITQRGQTIWKARDNKYGDRIILFYEEDGTPRSRILYPDWAMLGLPPPFLYPGQVHTYKPAKPEQQPHEMSPPSDYVDTQGKRISESKAGYSPSDRSEHHEDPILSDHMPSTIETSFSAPSKPTSSSSEYKPFELDINKRVKTEQYEYTYDILTKTMTYVPKSPYRFSAIWYGVNVLWSTLNPTGYAYKVTLTGYEHEGMFYICVYLDDHVKRFYKSASVPWTELDNLKPNALTLNVLSNFETFYYTVEIAGKYKTFIPKEGFKFYKVTACEYEIWETINSKEYAYKVVNEDDKRVTIYMDNEKLINFVRGHRGCKGCKGFSYGLLTCGIYNCTGTRWKEAK
ncbi:hypothetical protein MACK_002504 [Theileria orientalis]|uniref:Uncharacterized protein n=1 Tax=Theileria orientalis TaxID=68886 RepID=A0A976MEU9_THEOR|nr:hypothetical protein MACK_002504 [Theileria orientalis]